MLPLWATAGGAGPGAAGSVTGVFMAATVVSQLGVPRVLRAIGHRRALVLGCFALGLPAAVLPLSPELPLLVAVAVVRGVGFGLLTVTGAALVADLVPVAQRGRATGIYGVAVGVPQLVLLTGGVGAWATLGPTPVLLAGAVAPLIALPALRFLPRRLPASSPAEAPARGEVPPDRGELARRSAGPWAVMAVCAAAAGGVITVLPLTGETTLAALALFVLTAAQLAGRSLSGELVDRTGRAGLVTPVALAAVAVGAGLVALGVGAAAGPAGACWGWVLIGAAGVGAGFGAAQNDTLVTLFARAGPARTGAASSVWNTAYDSGTGLGATVLAAVLGGVGASASFVVAGAACLLVLPVAVAGARVRS